MSRRLHMYIYLLFFFCLFGHTVCWLRPLICHQKNVRSLRLPPLRKSGLHSSGILCSVLWLLDPSTMGPIDCPATSVTNYHSILRNIAEERRPETVANLGLKSGHKEIQPQKVASSKNWIPCLCSTSIHELKDTARTSDRAANPPTFLAWRIRS